MFARFVLYIILSVLVVSPSLASIFGVPRLDTALSYILPVLLGALLQLVPMTLVTARLVFSQIVLFLFGFVTLLSGTDRTNFPDIFFLSLPALLLLLLVWGLDTMRDPLNGARALLTWATMITVLPVYFEVATGFRFTPLVNASTSMEGIFKGTFFNPNDMSTVVAALLCAQIYFYISCPASKFRRIEGRALICASMGAILIGGSRTALLLGALVIFLALIIHASRNLRLPLVLLALGSLTLLRDLTWLEPILRWAIEIDVLSYSADKLYLSLFFFENDNSISYRAEIITYFFDNFRFVFAGYGPRNYGEFFREVSDSLAATNPHAYLIEIYLAFGVFGFLAMAAFFGQAFFLALRPERNITALRSRQKVMAALSILVFLTLSFVPSSILRLGVLWFPLTLIIWHQIYTQYVAPTALPRVASHGSAS